MHYLKFGRRVCYWKRAQPRAIVGLIGASLCFHHGRSLSPELRLWPLSLPSHCPWHVPKPSGMAVAAGMVAAAGMAAEAGVVVVGAGAAHPSGLLFHRFI